MTAITFKNQYNPYSYTDVQQADKEAKFAESTSQSTRQEAAAQELLTLKSKDHTFLAIAQEALIYQRLGVDKEKIDEFKAAISELAQTLQDQGADSDAIKAKMAELQDMLAQEYQKGRERLAAIPEHEKGKMISALV